MVSATSTLFLGLLMLVLVSPIAAFGVACLMYARYRDRVGPGRGISGVTFALAMAAATVVGGGVGLTLGISQACPKGGNLCGLLGVFVTGPLAAALAILVTAIFLIRSAPAPDAAG